MVMKYTGPGVSIDGHRIFIGRVIHSKSVDKLEILPKAALGVRPDGSIAFLSATTTDNTTLLQMYRNLGFQGASTITLKPSQFLFPGLIDTHLHAPQWPNLALGMEGDLREWCENYTDPIEASYSDTSKAKRVYADVVKTTLKLGSTTVAYNSTTHVEATNILADSCLAAGQRAIIGKLCILVGATHGNWEESTEASLKSSVDSIKHIRKIDPEARLIYPCIQPRGGPYCPPDLMHGLGDLCHKYKTHVQAHMCETRSDVNRTLELHPSFKSYSDMYKHSGLLNAKTILAHCIHLQPSDLANLKATGAGVAHNPNSNTCLRDGECRVRELLDMDIKVGLGTDCSAGYMPSIHGGMRSASNVSRHLAFKMDDDRYTLSFSEIVYLATVGGAQVVGMEDRIGNFEVGKKSDALLIDVDGVISVDPELWEDGEGNSEAMVKKWVFLGDDRTIRKVWVDGRLVSGHDLALT